MKKIITALAAVMLVSTFASCQSNSNGTDTAVSPDTTVEVTERETQNVAEDTKSELSDTEEVADTTDTNVVTDTSAVTGEDTTESVTDNVPDETKPAEHTHSFGEWKTVENATCEKAGLSRRSCACGASEEKELSKANHTPLPIRVHPQPAPRTA